MQHETITWVCFKRLKGKRDHYLSYNQIIVVIIFRSRANGYYWSPFTSALVRLHHYPPHPLPPPPPPAPEEDSMWDSFKPPCCFSFNFSVIYMYTCISLSKYLFFNLQGRLHLFIKIVKVEGGGGGGGGGMSTFRPRWGRCVCVWGGSSGIGGWGGGGGINQCVVEK